MHELLEKSKDNKIRAVADSTTQQKNKVNQGLGFVDHRPQAVTQKKLIFKDAKQPKKNQKHALGWRSFEDTVADVGDTEEQVKETNYNILAQASTDIETLAERLDEGNQNQVVVERGIHRDLQNPDEVDYQPEARPHMTIKFNSLGGKGGNPVFHIFALLKKGKDGDKWVYDGVDGMNEDAKPFLQKMYNEYFQAGVSDATEYGFYERDELDDRDRAFNEGARSVI